MQARGSAIIAVGGVNRRRSKSIATVNNVTAALALLCEICGGVVSGGAVSSGAAMHCSLECAQAASGRVPGNYLG
jgi:hypothetical protein